MEFLRSRRYSVHLRIEPIPEFIRKYIGSASISVSDLQEEPSESRSGQFASTSAGARTVAQLGAVASESRDGQFASTSVLFLAADPTDSSRLRLGEELREIQETLQRAKFRERFELHQRMSVRPADVSQALLDIQPTIVHFSGHGMATGALCFEDQVGKTHPVEPDALAALFEQFAT